ncbi:MAG: hypothetical protein APF82_07860 [Sphingomonadales bacterium BRH_c42]|nr:MAG: hypothetical protein APF82_07860 [Sphingomonadales bacterium BRH_c42]
MGWPGGDDQHGDGQGEAELALGGDGSLPWLDSGMEGEEAGGVDTGRIIAFTAIVVAVLALGIGALWWYSHRGAGEAIVADGSTIEAPKGPYKVRPADAGGKTFAGTGNIAPAVGEGQQRDARLARRDLPAPTIDTRSTADKPVEADGVGVQIGAYGSRAAAEAGWVTLRNQTEVLADVRHRVVKGQADIGTVYRLQAVAGDLAAAMALCDALKANGLACQVKR